MSIELQAISLRYEGVPVVDRVSLRVAEGELFVLLGASGSGKSTLLRLVSGLLSPDDGRVLLRGRDVTRLPPQERETGFVFQNYSIFRHMTVGENVEFGLRIRGVPAEERRRRREELLDLVGLPGFGERAVEELSGGERQRVALARALAYEPGVLLLDEPFGALDVRIRGQLRRSLREIQQRLRLTTILVTHDQEEGFELADRLGVLERGRLVALGRAEELYQRPATESVATFLGSGTVLKGRASGGKLHFASAELPIPPERPHEEESPAHLLIRPEHVVLGENRPPPGVPVLGWGMVVHETFGGATRRVRVRLPRPRGTRQVSPKLAEEALLVEALLPGEQTALGQQVWVSLRAWHVLQPPQFRVLVLLTCAPAADDTAAMAELLRPLHAKVTLLALASDPAAREELRTRLEERFAARGVAAQVLARTGDPARELIGAQAADPHDFVFMLAPASGRRALASDALQVLERGEVPVLLVRPGAGAPRRVLVCAGITEPPERDLRFGARLAARFGAEAALLHVTDPSQPPTRRTKGRLEKALEILRMYDVPGDLRVRTASSLVEGILEEAKEGRFDLVVLGRPRSDGGGIFPVRSATRQVLQRLELPLLLLPSPSAAGR